MASKNSIATRLRGFARSTIGRFVGLAFLCQFIVSGGVLLFVQQASQRSIVAADRQTVESLRDELLRVERVRGLSALQRAIKGRLSTVRGERIVLLLTDAQGRVLIGNLGAWPATTAYDEYAIRAFKLNSVDYLLKPIDINELETAINKYKSMTPGPALADQLKELIGQWGKEPRKYKERFLSVHRNSLVPITDQEIAFFHKEELIFIHTMKNEKMIGEHQTLDEIEGLVNPKTFFRVNRQYLMHIQCVGRVTNSHKGLLIALKPPYNLEVEVSREKATAFKKWIGE